MQKQNKYKKLLNEVGGGGCATLPNKQNWVFFSVLKTVNNIRLGHFIFHAGRI